MRRAYVAATRGVRRLLAPTGLLERAETSHSRATLWMRSLLSIYDGVDMAKLDVPWWTFPAIDRVQQLIDRRAGAVRVFEYGSGASTIWLARRCRDVVSVEHDVSFAHEMAPLFGIRQNVTLEIVPPEVPDSGSYLASRRRGYEGLSFDRYVGSIDRYDGLFDLIVVDGRARIHCLARATARLAADGVIVFDNSNRAEYRAAIAACGLGETVLRGLAPALPYRSQTSLLARPHPS